LWEPIEDIVAPDCKNFMSSEDKVRVLADEVEAKDEERIVIEEETNARNPSENRAKRPRR
jgi:hypothetical protein